jgi:hypothetical protein
MPAAQPSTTGSPLLASRCPLPVHASHPPVVELVNTPTTPAESINIPHQGEGGVGGWTHRSPGIRYAPGYPATACLTPIKSNARIR